ncbi:MAG TPA: pitrilysin family protein [Chitinophagales bacterium]|nr:pitrilysin family protein [Chitinophagales bacterium]
MFKKTQLAAAILIWSCITFAQNGSLVFNTEVEGVKQFTLKENGLRVLLIPDKTAGNVVVNIVYEVGSRHEGYGESGMAHLLEHMLFRSCKNFVNIKQAIAEKGAMANGTTSYDRTNYYEILPASDSNLSWALAMEADRMVNSKILQEELNTEFSVVRNEFEMGENDPDAILNERILSTMYLWHNYGKSTIGSKEDIERVTADRLKAFYQKYYQPDNAVLIVAGKFDEEKAKQNIVQNFASIPKPQRILQPTYTVEPPQDGIRYVELKRIGDMQSIQWAYHTPALAADDYAANDVLFSILTDNPNGILYKRFVETKLANSLSGYTFSNRDPGASMYDLILPKTADMALVEKELFKILNGMDTLTITQHDVDLAKSSTLKFWNNITDNTQRFSTFITDIIGAGDWRLWYKYRDDVEKVTLADVKKVIQNYYKPSNLTWGKFIPDKNPDRAIVPEIKDIDAIVANYKGRETTKMTESFSTDYDSILAKVKSNKTKNGLKYILLPKPTKSDVILFSVDLRFGNETALQNTQGINNVLASLMEEGTTTQSKEKIAEMLNKLKSEISFSGRASSLSINVKTTKANFSACMDILKDMLMNPKLSEADFQKIIQQNISNIEESMNDPEARAQEKLDRLTTAYPSSHPFYASTFEEQLAYYKNMKLSEVKAFYDKFYGANYGIGVVVGALNETAVAKAMENIFGKWNSKTSWQKINDKYFDVKQQTVTVNTPDKTNAVCSGNINLNISMQHPDFPALYMADYLLGGGAFLSSRIAQRLRENEGMSYGAGSYVYADYNNNFGNWGMYAIFNPAYKNRLDSALLDEIHLALDKGFTKDELEKAKIAWMQLQNSRLGTDNSLKSLFMGYLDVNRDLKDRKVFQDKVKALTIEQVNAALRKYFDLTKLVLVYAGDFKH